MYRARATTINPFPNMPIPSDLPEGFDTLQNYLTANTQVVINIMVPVTYNLPGLSILIPTQQLYQDAINVLINEYGWIEISSQDWAYLLNDIKSYFRRLCQLLALETIVTMNDILRNNYGHRSYRANSDQRIYEAVQEQVGEAEAKALSSVIAENTSTSNNQTTENGSYASTGQSTGSRDYAGNTNVGSQSDGKDITEVGQVNQRSVQISHPMANQAIDSVTVNFPIANGVTGTSTGVPDLSRAAASNASTNFGVTEANTANMVSTLQSQVDENRSVNESTRGTDTYNSNSNTTGSLISNTGDNTYSTTDSDSIQTSKGRGDTQSRTTTSAGYGTRESGFTTTAVFANQYKILMDILHQHGTAWDWWLEQFTWLRGIY